MASRWQHRIALSMMASCDVGRLQFVYTLLFEVSLGPGLVSSSSFPGVYADYPGFCLVFGV